VLQGESSDNRFFVRTVLRHADVEASKARDFLRNSGVCSDGSGVMMVCAVMGVE